MRKTGLRIALLAAACVLAACGSGADEPGAAPAAAGAGDADEPGARAPAGSDAEVPTRVVPALAPPPSDAPTDSFVGWYYEKGGTAMLVGCGQSVPLPVADAAFLRQLNARRGGASTPVYVRLEIRPTMGAQLEVAEVRQFGVDEGPAPDCALNLPR